MNDGGVGLRSLRGGSAETAEVTELDGENDLDLSRLRPRLDRGGEGLRLRGVGGGDLPLGGGECELSLSFSLDRDLLLLEYRFRGGGVGLLVFSLTTGEGGGVLSLLPDSISSSFWRLAHVFAR